MNTKSKKKCSHVSMDILLWGIMMVLVLVTVAFMWVFQIHFMERNYIESNIAEVQEQVEAVLDDLKTEDLAYNEPLLSSLSKAADGKLLIISDSGQLIDLYTLGHPIDLTENRTDIRVWERIAAGENYASILAGETYCHETINGNRIVSYEQGVPVRYYGQDAYLVLYHSFNELYVVLDMNRQQLVTLTILLTLAAAVLAGVLSKAFTSPILTIKKTVDALAAGDLTAKPGLKRRDEIGQLSCSVEKLGQALQRVDVLRKEVIANVSHELRSPLALIGGYAEMVRDITWKDDAQREDNLNLIISEANRMSEMVSDILDYSQLQSGCLQLNRAEYDLREIVESEVRRCEQSAQENHLTLSFDGPDEELNVQVDALKMSQVVRNLLNNAINHTKDGETIVVSVVRDSLGCLVRVVNPGEPIPEDERELIWERYQRSQHQAGRRQGTGIGLSIVKTILDAHGMICGVDCRDGFTSFWFRYGESEQPQANQPQTGKGRKHKMTGLLSMLFTLTLLAGCVAGNNSTPAVTRPSSSDESPAPSMENHRMIGELLPVPLEYSQEADEPGEVVRLDYTTANYANPSSSLEKYAYVYLPHGFNASDPETRYDVLYLLHGGGGNAERYFDGAGQSSQFKRILDHMIQNGELEPMIVVTPTFYSIGNTDSSVSTAGDAVAHFPDELVNDLIPAVESAYPTYAETTDAEGLKASRDHRGFGGFSMSSVATWYVFADCLDYFRYFLPMSGDCWISGQRAGGSNPAGTADALAKALKESGYGVNDFFIHAMTGTSDMAYDALAPQLEAMKEAEGFSFGTDTSKNNLYFSVLEGGTHDYSSIRRYLYSAMPVFWGAEDTRPAPAIDRTGSYSVEIKELFAENEGQQIYGLLYQPVEAEGPRPVVLYAHGFGSSYRNGGQYVQALAAQGYLVYCFDFRGGSESSRSEGSNLEMSIFTEQSDLEAVIAMMKERSDVDSRNIFLLGASQGGMVSAMTAADNEDDIAGAVLLYPAFVLVDDAKDRFSGIDEVPESGFHIFMTVGKTYFEKLFDYDVYGHIQHYTKDILLIHGDRDSIVPLSYSEQAQEVYPSAQLKVISGAGHGFHGDAAQQAIDSMSEYFSSHLNG